MSKASMIAIHRTYERTRAFNRDIVLYRSDGPELRGIMEINNWIKTLKEGTVVRSTYVNVCDGILLSIREAGAEIHNAHWHYTGIKKGLSPDEIAKAYAILPNHIFRRFLPNREIAYMAQLVKMRDVLLEERKRATQRMKAMFRDMGAVQDVDYFNEQRAALANARSVGTVEISNEKKIDAIAFYERQISIAAAKIPECQTFRCIAEFEAWNTAASVIVYSGGTHRFSSVNRFMAYCGHHIVDGHAPKAEAGKPINWNPKLRSVLWAMSDSIVKLTSNPWRRFYESEREVQTEKHDEGPNKCSCDTPDGHITARARLVMRQQILKKFFLACKNIRFQQDHVPCKPSDAAHLFHKKPSKA